MKRVAEQNENTHTQSEAGVTTERTSGQNQSERFNDEGQKP